MKKTESNGQTAIHPSLKLVRAKYTVAFTVLFLCVLAYTNWLIDRVSGWWLLAPGLLLVWPLLDHLRRRFTSLILAGDKLTYQTGVFSRSKRVILLAKVQDVRIEQTFIQRLWGIGDISVETAGETSLLTVRDLDSPDLVAEAILEAARRPTGEDKTSGKGRK